MKKRTLHVLLFGPIFHRQNHGNQKLVADRVGGLYDLGMAEESKKTMTPEQKLSLMFGRLSGNVQVGKESADLTLKLDGHPVECPGAADVLVTQDGSGLMVRSKVLFFTKGDKGWAKVASIPEERFRPAKEKEPALTSDEVDAGLQALMAAGFSKARAEKMLRKPRAVKQEGK